MGSLEQWISDELNKRSWSMRELARRSMLSQGYISRVLSGKQQAGQKFYLGVAKAFGLTPEAIERLDKEGVDPRQPDDPFTLTEIIEIAQKMTPDQRRRVLDYALYVFQSGSHTPAASDENEAKQADKRK